MAVFTRSAFVGLAVVLSILVGAANALSSNFYSTSCPNLGDIVRTEMTSAVHTEPRMAASILRLFFHDCFVNGCDGSILLDNGGEKSATPNLSVRGYEVIDAIKTEVNKACGNRTVSCADILALASRDGVKLVGGPTWTVLLGRNDSLRANQSGANTDLPSPFSNFNDLVNMFRKKNLEQEMTALSGAHTIGRSQCQFFRSRIYSGANINSTFATELKKTCPQLGNDTSLANFDVRTADVFDSAYYTNLIGENGLLHSDQELFSGRSGLQVKQVKTYNTNQAKFFTDFGLAMVKMGNLPPPPEMQTEIRWNCRSPN